VRTVRDGGDRDPAIEAWPRFVEVSPELIAYYRQRAHRLRARALRRMIYRVRRRITALARWLVRGRRSVSPI
jgi:hypothetical protein